MIERGTVISNALLRLGELGSYNDNGSVVYKRASTLFDAILDNVATDTSFLFNATTAKLTTTGDKSELDEYTFNRPVDMLNLLRTYPMKGVRYEGDHFYSTSTELIIQYCKKITITKYPDYMGEYLTYALCTELARTHNSYIDRLEYSEKMKGEERAKILAFEGFDKIIFDDEADGSSYLSPSGGLG